MKLIWRYVRPYRRFILAVMVIKLIGTGTDLLLPYVLEHLLDHVVPDAGDAWPVVAWGGVMLLLTFLTRVLNITANRMSVRVAKNSTFAVRRDLFHTALNLSGRQMDRVGLPSLISRMTSDTYNVQNFVRMIQTMGIRAPIMLLGGIAITLTMDTGLASILCVMAPVMIVLVCFVSWKGIPLYNEVQKRMDVLVRRMRESITGIRVVKALSKESYEEKRYGEANTRMAKQEVKASVIMSLPGPIVTLFLNIGLTLVVLVGARRVNDGATEPGVILAFLTYFNMILMGVMGLNRIFMMMSRANASAGRIDEVIDLPEELTPVPEAELAAAPGDEALIFDHVTFNYDADSPEEAHGQFLGEERRQCLKDISFRVPKGGSLGIIGATGSGKTSIINLLMRFYDPQQGHVFVDGKDVRAYHRDDLHRKFGVVFQNDVIFADTIRENVTFGRDVSDRMLVRAAKDAMARGFIESYEDAYDHEAAIRGANFSGGQKQRLLIARALASQPEILILDDASSALDYRTDAELRRAIREHHSGATTVVIAQRISSILSMDEIIVLHEGEMIGRGTHAELLESCPEYRDIYRTQMNEQEVE
ncbi:MAG: ABC transporter ATP-binding protein/permease [Clostridiales bacterium]|nr:ABC transporter ATP-binding protein/permease [Clostridiales bacterium]